MGRAVARPIDAALLRRWPLPQVGGDEDKEDRGDVLVVGGSAEAPGGVALAGTAALRAGAGRLAIATDRAVAASLAVHLPEARVLSLPSAVRGGRAAGIPARLREALSRCALLLAGPGWLDERRATAWTRALLAALEERAQVVLDAVAMAAAIGSGQRPSRIAVTPHAGEMAHLCGIPKDEVLRHAESLVVDAARQWSCVVVLKGATTHVATPEGKLWRHEGGNAGLATSGSGDVLAGVIAGLGARGASIEQAAVWGVALHARAGAALSRRIGPLGFLASELSAEVPALLRLMSSK